MNRKRTRFYFGYPHTFHKGEVVKLEGMPDSFRVVQAELNHVTVERMTWWDRFCHWFFDE